MSQIQPKRKISKNIILDVDKFRVYEALKENREKIEKECKSFSQVGQLIYGMTGVTMTKNQVQKYLEMAKIELKIKKPGSCPGGPLSNWINKFNEIMEETNKKIARLEVENRILLAKVEKLEKDLGVSPSVNVK